ncbi:replication-relaxation family protein [Nocardia cyriacigeorgica]|uniref:replication-relaxation family protein n=1 Tax=Nocardia cyriacigeorgica TaxID=135487 RepID=UPI0018946B87|nr:replication-relaxation family protein [Nocardia cyriacigeorgica]MBF6399206.1 replication-relaxation family protein [Nocardia cyriacigeorgica]MBF6404837.1 replication-relaxation family protein [Nocardia cyriacigeorgica]
MVHEHRVLTTDQLAALAFPTAKIARRRLAILYEYRVLDRFRPLRQRGSAPHHWTLAPTGATILAAEAGVRPRELAYNNQHTLAVAHGLHLNRTVEVNSWFTALITEPGHGAHVSRWWSQTRCQRLWGDLVRPDSYGRYTHPEATLDFFLAYEPTTTPAQIGAALHGYAELARTTGTITPLLWWEPTSTREGTARAELAQAWRNLPDPDAVPIATGTAELLTHDLTPPSPAAPVWQPLHTSTATRLPLHRLAAVWTRATLTTDPDQEAMPSRRATLLAAPPPQPPTDW